MKNSKINPKEVLKDAEKFFNIIDRLDNLDLDNINHFENELKELEKTVSKKYKDILEKKSEENLDSEE